MRRSLALLALVFPPSLVGAQAPREPAFDTVATVLGTPTALQGGYRRYNLPRRDLAVRVGDVTIAPALALGGWVGFDGPADHALMMGDLVVTADELAEVERALVAGGIDIAAVHNHLVGEEPAVVYLHLHGHGDAVVLARAVDAAISRTGLVRPVTTPAAPLTADTAKFFAAMGARGRGTGAVASVSLELVPVPVRMDGMDVKPAFGVASPVNMQWVTPRRAVTTGDFAVLEGQLGPLVRTLVSGGISVTALHSHLVGESPHVLYVHFWGDGDPAVLAATLRAAADAARAAK
ncbi:MAG: DUF1259 domain-containing protein [Gemmatimonadetes bacterium]|nr:DUF1259 domain-containing protein [Gemmatimonadota bacterium]